MTDHEYGRRLSAALKGKPLQLRENDQCLLPYGAGNGTIWLLQKGIVLCERNTDDGYLIGTGLIGPDSLIGIKSFIGEEGFVNCKAVTDSHLIGFKTGELVDYLYDEPDMMYHTLQLACRRFEYALNTIDNNSSRRIEENIRIFEDTLKELNDGKPIAVSDRILAEYLGVHPTSISRARKQYYDSRTGKE